MCACVLECEPCVNMLIQAVPVTHSCPAWLRSGKLIILAALMSVSPAVCVDSEEKVPLLDICHPLHHPCQRTIHDKCVCCNVLVSRQASLFFCSAIVAAIWCFTQTDYKTSCVEFGITNVWSVYDIFYIDEAFVQSTAIQSCKTHYLCDAFSIEFVLRWRQRGVDSTLCSF